MIEPLRKRFSSGTLICHELDVHVVGSTLLLSYLSNLLSQNQRRNPLRDAARASVVTYLDLSKLGEEGETPASEELWLTVDEEDPNAKGFLSTSSEEECGMGRGTIKISLTHRKISFYVSFSTGNESDRSNSLPIEDRSKILTRPTRRNKKLQKIPVIVLKIVPKLLLLMSLITPHNISTYSSLETLL